MILKCAVILFLLQVLQVEWAAGRQVPLPGARQKPTEKLSLLDLTKNLNLGPRRRRCLGTALSLLWPQVVGPVEQGMIEEHDYNSVPKTLLEHRLDMIRAKAKLEEESRLMVREYLKKLTEAQDEFYGVPAPYGNSLANYT